MDYPKWFDLEGLEGKPRRALRLSFDLAAVNGGDFVGQCESAERSNANTQARECIRTALSSAGFSHADAQQVSLAVKFG